MELQKSKSHRMATGFRRNSPWSMHVLLFKQISPLPVRRQILGTAYHQQKQGWCNVIGRCFFSLCMYVYIYYCRMIFTKETRPRVSIEQKIFVYASTTIKHLAWLFSYINKFYNHTLHIHTFVHLYIYIYICSLLAPEEVLFQNTNQRSLHLN